MPTEQKCNPSLEPASQGAVEMRNSNSSGRGKQCGTNCSVPSRSSVEEAGPRAHPATCFCLELSFPRTGKMKPEAPTAQRCSPLGGGRACREDPGPAGRLSLAAGRVTSAGRSFPGVVKGRGVCAARVSFGVLAAHLRAKDPEPSFPLKLFPSSAGRLPLRTGRPHPILQRPASPPARGPCISSVVC